MKKTGMFLMMFGISALSYAESEAQSLCIEQTVARCLAQCDKTEKIDCSSACRMNAKNECRQAGE